MKMLGVFKWLIVVIPAVSSGDTQNRPSVDT